MPRIACMETGRPTILSCSRPAQSTQPTGISIAWSNAASASSAAMRRMVAAGMPHCSRHLLRRVALVEIARRHQLEHRTRLAPIAERDLADQARRDVRRQRVVNGAGLVGAQRVAAVVAHEQAVARGPRRIHHQPGRVGVAHQEIEVDAVGLQQLMHDRQHEQAIGAGRDADPFVGDRGIAGAHRIDRDELGAVVGGAVLQLAQADLDRVAAVVLGDAEHQEIARALPVRLAEFPERAADGVEPGGRHVDRAEAAMRRVVRRAELRRPPAGQRLALVAAGEEGELLRDRWRGCGRATRSRASAPRPTRSPGTRPAPRSPTRFSGLRSRAGE